MALQRQVALQRTFVIPVLLREGAGALAGLGLDPQETLYPTPPTSATPASPPARARSPRSSSNTAACWSRRCATPTAAACSTTGPAS